jgi:menaquinone-dependent protoporphyrinogen oxidase
MSEKILVTYSTRTGSTKGVSEEIGRTLAGLGEVVDVLPMSEVSSISDYKAVIAGSAIQSGKWLPEAMDFISKYKNDLNAKPFASFLVCMTLAMPKGDQYRETVAGWLRPVRDIVTPVSEGLFKGALDIKRIPSFSDRLKFRLSVMFGVWKEGDHREWDAIRSWATGAGGELNKAMKGTNQ